MVPSFKNTAGKVENKKLEEHENENINFYFFW